MKKLLALMLTLILVFSLIPASFAASEEANAAADTLHALGLFAGKGDNPDGTPNYDLDAAPTRMEAVTMLVRLLGKEAEAKAGTWETPFTDVDEWAKPYVGYAYANGLTKGTGETTFGGKSLITATQYLTFVLRALGYDSSTDFKWDAAWELTDQLGITQGEYSAANNNEFLRGNVAEISVGALPIEQKGSTETLSEKLIADGVFTQAQYDSATQAESEEPSDSAAQDESGEPSDSKEEFTLTAFGDKELHEYLMSLNPSKCSLGPDYQIHFDSYWYEGQFIQNTIEEKIKTMYEFEAVVFRDPQKSNVGGFIGTRVETMNSEQYGFGILFMRFESDGYCYGKSYYITVTPYIRSLYGL